MRVSIAVPSTCLTVAAAAVTAMGIAAPAAHAARTCAPKTSKGVRVIRLQPGLGCQTGTSLAVRTVRAGGYYQSKGYYCRWGGGGSDTLRLGGKTYYSGGCAKKSSGREVSFYARKT